MTATLDTPYNITAETGACPTPDKRSFTTVLDALAFAAEHDTINGTDNHPYQCDCGTWHNTSQQRPQHKPKTVSRRIDLAAAAFPPAPLRPPTDLNVSFYLLHPKIAAFWLLRYNTHNRNLRDTGVSSLSLDLMTGGWEINGDAIRFACDGTLLDGQHRLKAIATSGAAEGRPVPIILVTGLEPTAQQTMDTGIRRSFADVLRLAGETDCVSLSALTNAVCLWKAGQYRNGRVKPSVKVLSRVLADHPELRQVLLTSDRVQRHLGGVPRTATGLASWLFRNIDLEDHDDFFDKLVAGTGLDDGHPVFVLRESLRRNAAAKAKLPKSDLLAYYIKSWNAYRSGSTIKLLAFKSGGKAPEAFPIPR